MLTSVLGSSPRGLAACRQARALYRELLGEDPGSIPLRKGLAHTLTELGYLQSQTGEVAAALGWPIGTVTSRIHAARMQLQKALELD